MFAFHQQLRDLLLLVSYLYAVRHIHVLVWWHINEMVLDWLDSHALDQLNVIVTTAQ